MIMALLVPETVYLLPQVCELTRLQTESKDTHYRDSWRYGTSYNTNRRDSFQSMTFGGHGITVNAASAKLYDVIAKVQRIANGKDRQSSFKPCQLSKDAFITQYRDCLCGKEWMEAHYKDEYPEPTIELSVDGKILSLSGNYKAGKIKEFIKANREG